MRAYIKTIYRTLINNLGRFIAISAIILLGISFMAGLGEISPKVTNSLNEYLQESKVADVIVKATTADGFSEAEISQIAELAEVDGSLPFTVFDLELSGVMTRAYLIPFSDMDINIISLTEGRLPEKSGEVIVERATEYTKSYAIGDIVTVMGMRMDVVGIAANPLTFSKEQEPSTEEGRMLDLIAYADSSHYSDISLPGLSGGLPVTDVYVKLKSTNGLDVFSNEYTQKVAAGLTTLKNQLGEENKVFLTHEHNMSWNMVVSYAEKIEIISFVFPIFFIAVVALVSLTTMTRLIEEERSVIGCYRTLGYSNAKIAFKYLFFSATCGIVGSVGGLLIGVYVVPRMIYPAFKQLYFLPPMTQGASLTLGMTASAIMFAAVIGVTLYVALRELKAQPAELLRPKAPRPGKKVFLEKITVLWKRLKFKHKSTLRNVFRYVSRFWMTVISIAGSTALVFAGFGLYNYSVQFDDLMAGVSDSLSVIAAVIIVFAALLSALVIFNLTNMNIGERKREIATLKVLGYHNIEVAGYIFREILVMAVIGIVAGLPIGYGLIRFLFAYLDFGALEAVQWYVFIAAAAMMFLFVAAVDLLLIGKIRKVDMNASLKSNE